MLNLIKKDLRLSKWFSIVYIIYPLFSFFTAKNTQDFSYAYVSSTIFLVCLSVFNIETVNERNHTYKVILSLPIKRTSVVISKYLSVMILWILSTVCCVLTSIMVSFYIDMVPIHVDNIMSSLSTVLILMALYIPLNLYFGSAKTRFVSIFIVFVAVMSSQLIIDFLKYYTLFMPIGIVLYSLSLLLSVRIYNHKDF